MVKLYKQVLFFFILLNPINCLFSSNFNNFGVYGLVNQPSAYMPTEGSMAFTYSINDPYTRLGTISASPFDWLETSFFYLDVQQRRGVGKNSYKSKGFNAKLRLLEEGYYIPQISIGLNDFAGTGQFSSEYLTFSKSLNNFHFNMGFGWGYLAGTNSFRNPIELVDKRFGERKRKLGFGGNIDLGSYFSGDSSLFYGLSYERGKFNFSYEYDTSDYDYKIKYKEVKSRHNFSIRSNPLKGVHFSMSFERGNSLNFNVGINGSFIESKKNKIVPLDNETNNPYANLQRILQLNQIGLRKISIIDDGYSRKAKLEIRQNYYQDQIEADVIAMNSVKKTIDDHLDEVILETFTLGMKSSTTSGDPERPSSLGNNYSTFTNEDAKTVYRVIENYPYFNYSVYPSIRNFIASRENFYIGGLLIESDLEAIFDETLLFEINLKYPIYSDFDQLVLPPKKPYPNLVRSDIKKYFNEIGKGATIGRMQISKYFSHDSHYFSFSAGLLEEMFGGFGLEYLFWKNTSPFSAGFEYFQVKKRDYELLTSFLDYRSDYYHLNLYAHEPRTDIHAKISYGKYLAGDIGYTIDMSRRFSNGVEFGFFFTITDVPFNKYGEGSFDKGLYWKIPFSFLRGSLGGNQLSKNIWRPLTKDPGSKLIRNNELYEVFKRNRLH